MTREEAISLIKSAQLMLINPTTNEPVSDLYAALDMAISALKQEPPTFNWVQNRVDLAKAEIHNSIYAPFCTRDEAIGLGIALNVIDKYFTKE